MFLDPLASQTLICQVPATMFLRKTARSFTLKMAREEREARRVGGRFGGGGVDEDRVSARAKPFFHTCFAQESCAITLVSPTQECAQRLRPRTVLRPAA